MTERSPQELCSHLSEEMKLTDRTIDKMLGLIQSSKSLDRAKSILLQRLDDKITQSYEIAQIEWRTGTNDPRDRVIESIRSAYLITEYSHSFEIIIDKDTHFSSAELAIFQSLIFIKDVPSWIFPYLSDTSCITEKKKKISLDEIHAHIYSSIISSVINKSVSPSWQRIVDDYQSYSNKYDRHRRTETTYLNLFKALIADDEARVEFYTEEANENFIGRKSYKTGNLYYGEGKYHKISIDFVAAAMLSQFPKFLKSAETPHKWCGSTVGLSLEKNLDKL